MTLAISREAMEKEFGAGHLVTVPADRLNPAVTHAPTARFLTEVGMPDLEEFFYTIDEELASGLESALGRQADLSDYTDQPVGDWVVLGSFMGDMFLLDGATGVVWISADGEGTINLVNSGIDLFARFLAAFHRDAEALHPDFNAPDEIEEAMNNLVAEVRGFDPAAIDHELGYWQQLSERVAWQI
ncbi:SUKH-4 family immunity protein [Streptomyces sp. TP-A0356]|uniref:SUKH-4 family immunity protein n=1 Tax=Streptomyces sp. TP-A0356 TaxID=1359208 RepID=UPI0006E206AB|nr:SUKH-4 family immunity protein [Streptomyces sp. TP-A0356]